MSDEVSTSVEPVVEPAEEREPKPPVAETSKEPASRRKQWWQLPVTWVAAGGLVVAVALSAGWATSSSASSRAIADLYSRNKVQAQQISGYKNVAVAVQAQKVQNARDQAANEAAAAAVKAREDAVTKAETQIVASQFSDGVHLVGTNLRPGVYSISEGSSCYYAWLSGTGSGSNIISNNIVNGPTTVTLKAGDIFETSSCGTWNKVG